LAVSRLQLLPGENLLVEVRPHWSFLTGPLAVSAVAIAIGVALDVGIPHTSVALHWVEGLVVAVPCLWLAARVVRWRSTRVVLTSMRIIERWGILSRQEAETMLAHVASVTVVQTMLGRIIGSGRIELEVRGDDQLRWLADVRKPAVVRRVIHRRLQPYADPGPTFG
jgi:uncharacterized membrane protein YdbT with pleckstrin-like domain